MQQVKLNILLPRRFEGARHRWRSNDHLTSYPQFYGTVQTVKIEMEKPVFPMVSTGLAILFSDF
jgi:hypothetical protein